MYGLFEVTAKDESENTRIVYGVHYNIATNRTYFLFFDENSVDWIWMPADLFEPIIPKNGLCY